MEFCLSERNPQRPPEAYLIQEGLEPLTFTNIFPQWERNPGQQVRHEQQWSPMCPAALRVGFQSSLFLWPGGGAAWRGDAGAGRFRRDEQVPVPGGGATW